MDHGTALCLLPYDKGILIIPLQNKHFAANM